MKSSSQESGVRSRQRIARAAAFPVRQFRRSPLHFNPLHDSGFSLIELVITVTVLAILTLGVVPLVQVSVKRQKEVQLREALREMREAIDQFHREAVAGAQMQANQQQGQTSAQQEQAPRPQPNQNPQNPQNPQQGGVGNIFS